MPRPPPREHEDHFRFQRHEFYRIGERPLHGPPSPAIVDVKIAAFRPAKLLQSFTEGPQPKLSFGITFPGRHQHANSPHALSLLRTHHHRPRHHRAAENL
jgi:hypothetical protein